MNRPENRSVGGESRETRERKGKGSASIKYPDSLVATIRRLYRLRQYGYSRLATMFSVPRSTIRQWIACETRRELMDV